LIEEIWRHAPNTQEIATLKKDIFLTNEFQIIRKTAQLMGKLRHSVIPTMTRIFIAFLK